LGRGHCEERSEEAIHRDAGLGFSRTSALALRLQEAASERACEKKRAKRAISWLIRKKSLQFAFKTVLFWNALNLKVWVAEGRRDAIRLRRGRPKIL
jgi:ribosomal protein L31E